MKNIDSDKRDWPGNGQNGEGARIPIGAQSLVEYVQNVHLLEGFGGLSGVYLPVARAQSAH